MRRRCWLNLARFAFASNRKQPYVAPIYGEATRFSPSSRLPSWWPIPSNPQSHPTLRASFSSLPAHTELTMPALSPTMSSGNLIEWKVSEGQAISPGDVLAEVETDKATLSWENQDEGYVAKLLVPDGSQGIKVGSSVAIIVEEEDQLGAFKDYQGKSEASGEGRSPSTAEGVTTPVEDTGAPVASMGVPANSRLGPAARTLLEEAHLVLSEVTPSGPMHIVTKGDVLAAITVHKDQTRTNMKHSAAKPTEAPKTPPKQETQSGKPPSTQQPNAVPNAGRPYTDVPTSQIRRIIAQRLVESKSTIPHMYITGNVELDAISQLREALKAQGTKVSVNDCVIKAAALALAEVPAANARWDATTETTVPSPSVDISVAVATEGGLMTPIVKSADQKSLIQISAEVRELAGRARSNKLKPEEFTGGSFSISNLGMFGVDEFSAIVNPPQAAIMAVGGSRRVARMSDGMPSSASVVTVTISADGRVYDGAVASQFLAAFARNMANPFRLVAN